MNNELTAALLTIEKCRELSGCPAGVDLQEWLKQLAAENVGLKASIPPLKMINDVTDSWDDVSLAEEVGFNLAISAIMKNIPDTPATDRIVAGIKADGVEWIEGNEPAEFGRYWVRYETDVGPQYCSAKWIEHNFCASSDTNIHKIWLADHSRSISSLKGVTHYTKLPASLEGGAL